MGMTYQEYLRTGMEMDIFNRCDGLTDEVVENDKHIGKLFSHAQYLKTHCTDDGKFKKSIDEVVQSINEHLKGGEKNEGSRLCNFI